MRVQLCKSEYKLYKLVLHKWIQALDYHYVIQKWIQALEIVPFDFLNREPLFYGELTTGNLSLVLPLCTNLSPKSGFCSSKANTSATGKVRYRVLVCTIFKYHFVSQKWILERVLFARTTRFFTIPLGTSLSLLLLFFCGSINKLITTKWVLLFESECKHQSTGSILFFKSDYKRLLYSQCEQVFYGKLPNGSFIITCFTGCFEALSTSFSPQRGFCYSKVNTSVYYLQCDHVLKMKFPAINIIIRWLAVR